MFEYLMPLLVMPTYENTLLDQTYRAVVRRQIEYGRQRGVPWGISESGYNTIDVHLNYQYRAFGVPGLGLKRGLAEDLVDRAVCQRHGADGGARGGVREPASAWPRRARRALRILRSHRLHAVAAAARAATSVTVRQFMAHHQGMSLLALAYLLLDRPMQRRFEADPMFRAADLLLQERVPKVAAPFFPHVAEAVRHAHRLGGRTRALCGSSPTRTRRPRRSICSPTAAIT